MFVVVGAGVPTVVGGGDGGGAPRCVADDDDPFSSLSSLSSVSDGGSAVAAHKLPSSSTSIIGGSYPLSWHRPTCLCIIALITCGGAFTHSVGATPQMTGVWSVLLSVNGSRRSSHSVT